MSEKDLPKHIIQPEISDRPLPHPCPGGYSRYTGFEDLAEGGGAVTALVGEAGWASDGQILVFGREEHVAGHVRDVHVAHAAPAVRGNHVVECERAPLAGGRAMGLPSYVWPEERERRACRHARVEQADLAVLLCGGFRRGGQPLRAHSE